MPHIKKNEEKISVDNEKLICKVGKFAFKEILFSKCNNIFNCYAA